MIGHFKELHLALSFILFVDKIIIYPIDSKWRYICTDLTLVHTIIDYYLMIRDFKISIEDFILTCFIHWVVV
jgi:hypothetical protein